MDKRGNNMSISELKEIQKRVIKKNKIINYIFLILTAIILLPVIIQKIYTLINNNTYLQMHFFISSFIQLTFIIVFILIIFIFTKNIFLAKDTAIFNKNYKQLFVLDALKQIFEDLKYDSNTKYIDNDFDKYKILYQGDSNSSNDSITGKYKNIKFEQEDIHIEKKEEYKDSDGDTKERWVTIFLGRWMNYDFNKDFKTNVIVCDSIFYTGSWNYKKVKMEDEEFNKIFRVYAENEHEAFYILTPHFMEKLKKIKNILNCPITFGFIDSKLYIALNNNEDSFEYNILKPINEEEIRENILKDIKVITDFVDELNLDNDLFKKGV